MAIGGAFLGGGVEVVPAGSCKLELEILTEDRANLTATFTIKGTSTYTVTAGADGRAVYIVPAGQTYTVSVNTTGYDNIASQTVIAESGTVRYVRFEAFAGRVKRSGDTMTGTLAVVGGVSIDTNGQVIGKKLRATADNHLGSSPSSYAVINDGWIQNRTLDETKSDLGITSKQDKLTAGENITIDGTTISAKDTTYDVATQSANGLMSSSDKTKLDGVDSALAGKVSKSGDTMTDTLTFNGVIYPLIIKRPIADGAFPSGTTQSFIIFQGNSKNRALIGMGSRTKDNHILLRICDENGNTSTDVQLRYDSSTKTSAFFAPTPSDASDNSTKVATTAWVNTASCVVHTTGGESIAGVKTFTNDMWLYMSNPKIFTRDTNGDFSKAPSETTTPFYIQCYDKNGLGYGNILSMYHDTSDNLTFNFGVDARHWKSGLQVVSSRSGNVYATAPTTPTGAIGSEIVTANWSLSKFQRKITYGTGDPPSGGQAGDIYIKI